jgi:hypothetical protein
MRDPYLDEKVREALLACGGSRGMAQKLLMEWGVKDLRLLVAMARPFLKAIAGAAVEGAGRRGVVVPETRRAAPSSARSLSPEALDEVLARMGSGGLVPPPSSSFTSPSRGTPSKAFPKAPLPSRTAGSGSADASSGGASGSGSPNSGIGAVLFNQPVQPAAGAGHVKAMHAIAAAFKKKH